MKLLADENFPFASFKYLLSCGYDIEHISEVGSGISDESITVISEEQERIILTFDSDFGELIYKEGQLPYGVIYFRWLSFTPKEPGQYLHGLISNTDLKVVFEKYMTVISRDHIRQRAI